MTFHDSARKYVLLAADVLESQSLQIGIMRSVDATEASSWLKEIAQRLREACSESEEAPTVASPAKREEGDDLWVSAVNRSRVAIEPLPLGSSFVVGGYAPDPPTKLLSLRLRDTPDTHRLIEQMKDLPDALARGASMTIFVAGEWVQGAVE